ncbi:NUDC1-like protein [Mya arenaria]|uniref:NudC domain-containing protein 1 n=1 Tax=Mya arenaria TaxID=6604 RepID=A0ABY7EWK4_MYAAR|nr:NUDC1-like protein [Mya arenaria]
MAASMELRPDRNLLHPNFEGYKLSLDKLPTYSKEINDGVCSKELSDDQFSYHHAKLFGVHNSLVADPWSDGKRAFFIDKQWNIRHTIHTDTSVSVSEPVYTISDLENRGLVPSGLNPHLHFLSCDLVVIGDGTGQVHIVATGNRQTGDDIPWKTLLTKTFPEENVPCMLVDAVEMSEKESHHIEILLVHVAEATPEQKDKYQTQYLTVLEWATFTSVDRVVWSLDRTRQLIGRKPFHYASLGRVDYTWHQDAEEINIQFTLPEGIESKDIYMTLTFNHIDLGVKNKAELLKGDLCGEIDKEGSTWTKEGRRLDVTLRKREGVHSWPLIVEGDTRGKMVMHPDEVHSIHERLAHLTSEEWNPCPDKQDNKPYNTQQLEECDMYPDDDSVLVRIDCNTHKATHRIGLGGHQWLFNVAGINNNAPLVCLRHDVDGLLWKQETSQSELKWVHTATFNAFGYVQASKQQRKFSVCPPDHSYVIICENTRHVYLYRQSTPVSTPLRNRKTGEQVKEVAKQQVITLDNTDTIVGTVATNDRFFAMTQNKLFMIKWEYNKDSFTKSDQNQNIYKVTHEIKS